MEKITATYLLLSLLLSISIFAQQESQFEFLTSAEGLSQNSIYAIHQDKFGFMWFGTGDGLNRYDGYDIITFHNEPFNSHSLPGNFVVEIAESDNGNLFINTQSGLCRYIIEKNSFERINLFNDSLSSESRFYRISASLDNTLWIGTENGMFNYNPENQNIKKTLPSKFVPPFHFIYEDSDTTLWTRDDSSVCRYDPKTNVLTRLKLHIKRSGDNVGGPFCEGPDNRIWIGSSNGIYVTEKNSHEVHGIKYFYPWISENDFRTVKSMARRKDEIWFGGVTSGVHKIDCGNKTVIHYMNSLKPDIYPGASNIMEIFTDNSDEVWIGTNGAGIVHHNPEKNNLRLINNVNYGILNQSIRAIYKDKENSVWIGGYRGLDKLNRATGENIHYSGGGGTPDLSGDIVYAIGQDPENSDILWLGFLSKGFDIFIKKTGKCSNIIRKHPNLSFLKQFTPTHFIFEGNKFIWMATHTGLIKLDRNFNVLKFYHPGSPKYKLSNENVEHIYKDVDGYIWAATKFGGVNKIDEAGDKIIVYKNNPSDRNSLVSNKVFCCARDGYGFMWFGTESGLDKFDPVEESFVHYTTKNGLANNHVYGILVDERNDLWISTNNGISKFNPRNNTFKNFTKRHNLQDREFNTNAFHRAYDNELFFGGIRGINSVFSKDIYKQSGFPEIKLTNLKIYNESVTPGKSINSKIILDKIITAARSITLDYSDNSILFEFAALSYFDNESIQYAYKLEDNDRNWHETGSGRYAAYANLAPGNYIFKVKSTNAEGSWNTEYLQLPVIVKPPLWKNKYAYFLYIMIATSIIVGLFISYRNKSRNAKQELIKQKEIAEKLIKVDKLKDNFLAQVSHEIRTPINSILSFTSLIESEFKANIDDDLKFGLDSIHSSGRRIIRTIDLLLNFSEIQSGTYIPSKTVLDLYPDILKPIFAEYKPLANKKGLVLKLAQNSKHYLIKGDNYAMTQIFANLIENAIKYTETGTIEILPYERGNTICIDVKDTGIGISKEFLPDLFNPFRQETEGYTRRFEGNGLGLALVKKYCEMNDGIISVVSEKGKGTTFTVTFPRA